MRSSPTEVESGPNDRDAAALAGHLAALCDYAVARLEQPADPRMMAEVNDDLRLLRDMCAALAHGAAA